MPRNRRAARQQKQARPNLAWLWVVLGVLAIAGAFLLLQSGTGPSTQVSVAEAYQKYLNGAFFLDVRSQSEWDQTHIANSILIPLDQLASRLGEVPKDRDVVVICRSGARSKEGMAILRGAGYARVVCMTGGLIAWQAAGYPLEGARP